MATQRKPKPATDEDEAARMRAQTDEFLRRINEMEPDPTISAKDLMLKILADMGVEVPPERLETPQMKAIEKLERDLYRIYPEILPGHSADWIRESRADWDRTLFRKLGWDVPSDSGKADESA